MGGRGQACLADVLVFALMVTIACSLLIVVNPVESIALGDRYAVQLTHSILLALQHSTANEFGGLTYRLNIQAPWGSTSRELRHKTLSQLLVEDALCNLRVKVNGRELEMSNHNRELDDAIRDLLKRMLDKFIGGRYGYSLRARIVPTKLSPSIQIYFEISVESLGGEGWREVHSETISFGLPLTKRDLVSYAGGIGSIDFFQAGPEIAVEVTLSLWSR
ncbi:MAG: hypothetical protein QXP65_04440 [Candidatus Hadarchaeales archaeon]